jgi:uncharacterized membrane protein YqgA involved in biofilm formation
MFSETRHLQACAAKTAVELIPTLSGDYPAGTALYKYQWDAIHDHQKIWFSWLEEEEEGESHDVKINELITWIKNNKGKVTDLDRRKFYNFNYWGNHPLEARLDGKKTWVYTEIFDDGNVTLKSPDVDFIINEKYHSGFYLSYKYDGKTEEAIRIWTYSYTDFIRLLKELGYTLTESFKTKITNIYKDYLANYGNDCNKIDVVFENVPDFVISDISIDDRVKYLKTLVGCPMFNGGWIWGKEKDTDEELAAFNLINTQDNQKALIDRLLSEKLEGEPLLKKLDSRLSDVEFVFPDKNYGKFAGIMWDYIEKSYPVQDKLSLYRKLHDEDKVFRWTHKLNGNFYSSSFGNNGIITISYNEVINTSYADYNGYLPLIENTKKQEFPVNAYDYVCLHFEIDLPALNVKKGDVCFVPAYVLHNLISERINESTKDFVRIGLDIASIAIGMSEIKAGVKGARLFFQILEIGTALGDIALTGFEDKLNETPEGAKFLKAFNTIALVGSIANIGQEGITMLNNTMPDEIATLRNIWKKNPKVKDIVKTHNPTACNQIDNLVDELDKYDEWAKYAGDLGGELTHLEILINRLSDELQTLVKNYKKIGKIEEGADNILLFKNANNEVVGKIIENKFYLSHSGWGGDIVRNETRRTTIIGKYNADKPGGTHALLKTGIPNASLSGEVDFRILSNPEIDNLLMQAQKAIYAGNYKLADELYEQAWEINRQWLDEAIENNDVIRLISEPISDNLMLTNHYGKRVLSFFGREIDYLKSKGYILKGYEFIKK